MSTATTPTVRSFTNPKTGATVESPFTDAEAATLCLRLAGGQSSRDFGRDMGNRVNRNLPMSPAQMFWLHRLAVDQHERENVKPDAPAAQPAGPAWSFPTANIVSFLEPAIKHRKSGACVTFQDNMAGSGMSNNGTVQIKRIVPSRSGRVSNFVGDYYVTDGGPFGQNLLYGRITKDGNFVPHRPNDPVPPAGVLVLLDRFAEDPIRFVQEYGVRTGKCCFCNHALEDPNSYKLGYGPVCAGHYNLPHGDKAVKALEGGKPLGEQRKLPPDSIEASDLRDVEMTDKGFAFRGLWWVKVSEEWDSEDELISTLYQAVGTQKKLTVFND